VVRAGDVSGSRVSRPGRGPGLGSGPPPAPDRGRHGRRGHRLEPRHPQCAGRVSQRAAGRHQVVDQHHLPAPVGLPRQDRDETAGDVPSSPGRVQTGTVGASPGQPQQGQNPCVTAVPAQHSDRALGQPADVVTAAPAGRDRAGRHRHQPQPRPAAAPGAARGPGARGLGALGLRARGLGAHGLGAHGLGAHVTRGRALPQPGRHRGRQRRTQNGRHVTPAALLVGDQRRAYRRRVPPGRPQHRQPRRHRRRRMPERRLQRTGAPRAQRRPRQRAAGAAGRQDQVGQHREHAFDPACGNSTPPGPAPHLWMTGSLWTTAVRTPYPG
jgi:hypothetical protein